MFPTGIDLKQEIVRRYYENTYWDYRVVWTGRRTLACHFGFYADKERGHAAALLRANEEVHRAARLKPGARVLDAGCGIGGTSLWLAENANCDVLGIGLSEKQVARAERAARERGLSDKVQFAIMDYSAVALEDSSFDAVIAIESLCHASDKSAFFAEAYRLLRPGGWLVVSDFMRARPDRDETERKLMREWCDGWAMADLGTLDEHGEHARETGFGVIEKRDVTVNVRPSLRRLYQLSFLGMPLSILFRNLRIRNAEGHANVIASRRQYQALRRGLWNYCHLAAQRPPSSGEN